MLESFWQKKTVKIAVSKMLMKSINGPKIHSKGRYTLDIFTHNIAIKRIFWAMDLYRPR